MTRTHKGIYYFTTYDVARRYATRHNHPISRIVHYSLGWAIQLRAAGPYVGPEL